MIKKLSNGKDLEIPEQYGAYILSTGCGSGKTTMFKSIIEKHWKEGILYSVDSRRECIAMYEWINSHKISGLKNSDIFLMFSKEENTQIQIMADDNLRDYKQDPGILLNKKVVIIPHPRLFSDIPTCFLIYQPKNPSPSVAFDGDFHSLMTRDDLRKWILIDETPQFFKPLVKFEAWVVLYQGHNIEQVYNTFIKGSSCDPFKSGTKLDRLKRDTALTMLPKLIPDWKDKPQNSYNIQFYPKDFVQTGMKTNLYLAEGVGDVLFSNQSSFKLIDVETKYQSKLELRSFSFSLNRKSKPNDKDREIFLDKLKNIITNEQDPVLVVVWKDFNENELSSSDDNAESEWRDTVRKELIAMGVPESHLYVTYYGATDTKSTNEYRDCGSLICCGKWFLPATAIDKLNAGYNGNCDSKDFNLYQYVQLVYRIGIRHNNGKTYRMYYSQDFEENGKFSLGNRLIEYINQNKYISSKSEKYGWKNEVERIKNGKKQIESIEKLIFAKHLDSDKIGKIPQSITLSLKEISSIVPKSRKARKDDYNSLKKVLNHLDVTLTISK